MFECGELGADADLGYEFDGETQDIGSKQEAIFLD